MQVSNQMLIYLRDPSNLKKFIMDLMVQKHVIKYRRDTDIRTASVEDRMRKLQEEYFVIEDNQIKKEGEGDAAMAVLQEGKERTEFDAKFKELMEKATEIKILGV